MRRFHVICSGTRRLRDGETVRLHGRISWPDLVLADDGTISQAATRRAPGPGAITGVDDGELVSDVGRKTIVRTEEHRAANGTWRWRCAKCDRDVPISEPNLLRWMEATPDGSTLDLSAL